MSKSRKNAHVQKHCVDCGTEVSRYAERCTHCRGNQKYFNAKSTVDTRFTTPRGSKKRKALGLEPLDFSASRGYGLEVNA